MQLIFDDYLFSLRSKKSFAVTLRCAPKQKQKIRLKHTQEEKWNELSYARFNFDTKHIESTKMITIFIYFSSKFIVANELT